MLNYHSAKSLNFSGLTRMALLLGLGLASLATAATAQDSQTKFIEPSSSLPSTSGSPWTFAVRSDFVSSYYYRGIQLYDGVSIQPSVGAFYSLGDAGTIGATLWMQLPAENNQRSITLFDESGNQITVDQNQKFFELDPTISYDVSFDKVTVSAGHIWYTDPGYGSREAYVNGVKQSLGETSPDTAEFYAGVALDTLLQPQLTIYTDYRTLDYVYYAFQVSHTFEPKSLGDDFNLSTFAVFGFAANASDDKRIYNRNGLEHINVGVSTALNAGVFQVKPHFTYVFGTDSEVEDVSRTSNEFLVGVDVGYDFSGF